MGAFRAMKEPYPFPDQPMKDPYPIPDQMYLDAIHDRTPEYMYPSKNPIAMVWEAGLTDMQCDAIIERHMKEESYQFPSCEATTRECPRPLDRVLDPMLYFGVKTNKQQWDFKLDVNAGAWMQTYFVGDSYPVHTDSEAGQTRKLTVIALLTDPNKYEGGNLRIHHSSQHPFYIPRARGTMVVIPSWVFHDVTAVEEGSRQSLNLGFWGPPFK
jgi:hypothetical protein